MTSTTTTNDEENMEDGTNPTKNEGDDETTKPAINKEEDDDLEEKKEGDDKSEPIKKDNNDKDSNQDSDAKEGAQKETNNNKQEDEKEKEEKFTTITEGSITMKYPADEESTVFYNPVQVQNRDLSILMLTLYSERRAVRKAVAKKRKEIRKLNMNKEGDDRISPDDIRKQLEEYEASLIPTQVALDQAKDDNDEGLVILDALAASGLRSMRYWKEIPGVKHVTINDLEMAAVERAHTNIEGNGLSNMVIQDEEQTNNNNTHNNKNGGSSHVFWQRPRGIKVQNGDAKIEMYMSQRPQSMNSPIPNNSRKNKNLTPSQHLEHLKPQWDVIDLDPYGSAAPFLDAAMQAIESGGMLCVTCTDMAALGGSHPETCFGRYASMPIPNARYLQEVALRILLYSLATTAAKYGRTIRPILSVGMNFYIRVFVEVKDDKAGCNKLSLQLGSVYQSTQCSSFHTVTHGRLGGKKNNCYQPQRAPATPRCEETGAEFKVGGPMWLGPLHDPEVVQTALDRLTSTSSTTTIYPDMKWIATRERLEGLLMNVKEELVDVPLYWGLPDMCKTLRITSPPLNDIKAALMNAGYKVSGYHKDPQAIKTDAPGKFMWDILRKWCEKGNGPKKPPPKDSPAEKILATKATSEIDFSHPKELRQQIAANNRRSFTNKGGKKKVSRFPMNPQAHWGPKKAASGKRKLDDR